MEPICVREALKMDDSLWVDLRTPKEYRKGSIPGALNIPLFTDKERHLIGITYQKDPEEARLLGFNLAVPKLPLYLDRIRERGAKRVILYCFRGGLRSMSVARVMDLMDFEVYQLEGGYKRFRSFIIENLPLSLASIGELLVIYGLTGAGKTDLIRILKSLGYPALDLEDLAHHRGSTFGRIGIEKPQSQRDFEALLFFELEKYRGAPYLIIEAESRNIGKVTLPGDLEELMKSGEKVLLCSPMRQRVDRIVMEYASIGEEFIPKALKALERLKKRLGIKRVNTLKQLLEKGELQEVVNSLLEGYYDPLYRRSIEDKEFYATIEEESITRAAMELVKILHQLQS